MVVTRLGVGVNEKEKVNFESNNCRINYSYGDTNPDTYFFFNDKNPTYDDSIKPNGGIILYFFSQEKTINKLLGNLEFFCDPNPYLKIFTNSIKVKENYWGSKVVSSLADELQLSFPGITGFNSRDLAYMKQFYETYADSSFMPPLVAQISWSNNRVILDKIKDIKEAKFYVKKCISNGWSKYDLIDKINTKTYENSLLSQNNFNKTLEVPIDLKRRVAWDFRDDYGIELINGEDPFGEKLLEDSIMHNLNKFLLAIDGKFSFVGRQIKTKTLQIIFEYFF